MELKLKLYLQESIMQKGHEANAGSTILKGFISPFDAAVVERSSAASIDIAGRVSVDEFSVLTITDDQPEEITPAVERVVADLSGEAGPATAVLCNDLFGKVRRQAAAHNLYYLQPSYGTVSRYGLIPSASSMDQIGILTSNLTDAFMLLTKLAGKDERDGAMYPETAYDYGINSDSHKDKDGTGHTPIRLAFPSNVWAKKADSSACTALFTEQPDRFDIVSCELKYFELFRQVLYILSCAEICNNTNRYDGIKFGYRSPNYKSIGDLYVNSRSEALGLDAKLTIIMGAKVLAQENYTPLYEQAMKIRRLIKEAVNFSDYDVIALPTSLSGEPYEESALHALTALAGLPSITLPEGGGIQLIANSKREDLLYRAWEVLKV
ncbi:MAG: hypothetical protein LBV33_06615 [Lachnospiraceae bacterium]|jgi:aspartyl-tRNA(Asn)/glutamyl-tRNA(Gln) amidotransferase subunit A|nr:hypothetical protein [Lachnospiraceae bacterium]